jgi:hypothetical protein
MSDETDLISIQHAPAGLPPKGLELNASMIWYLIERDMACVCVNDVGVDGTVRGSL